MCVTPHAFSRQMHWLRQSAWRPVALDEIVGCLAEGRPPPENGIAVTFDDGFGDLCEHALPILRTHSIPATMYAVASLLGRTNEWMDKRAFPARRIVSESQLRELDAAGVAVGSHSLTHPRMSELSPADAAREAHDSKRRLEDVIGKPVRHFAYPYGSYNAAVKSAVRAAGYTSATTTRSGFNSEDADPFELRRIDVVGTDSLEQFRRKIEFGANRVTNRMLLEYYAGRIRSRLEK